MATKRSLSLSLDGELIDMARSTGLNLSTFLEERLREKLQKQLDDQWKHENAEAIQSLNDYTEKHGLWCDEFRTW